MAQYSEADNARRKTNNVGIERVHAAGHNAAIKQYSRNIPAGSQTDPKMKRRQPVTQWTPEQIAAENAKRGLKKSWGEHLPFPSAEEEIMRLAGVPTENGEDAMANQLANMMQSKSMLNHKNPSRDEFIAAGEAMGLGVSEEVAKSAEQQWSGAINNWLAEATKPISQRFASEEEELAYWNNIKVGDTGGDHGY
jgi:hypothetical protein